MNIAVLLTVYNRKQMTLKGITSFHTQIGKYQGIHTFDIYVVDDGSMDGTSEAIKKYFPDICLIEGNGNLYWGGGMNLAWKTAYSLKHYDYYFWINDDAELYDNSFDLMFKAIRELGDKCLVSGAFCDNEGKASYGGRDTCGTILEPNGNYQDILFMNGNFVLVSEYVFRILGYIDYAFPHELGDWDYGLRALKKGIKVYLTPDYVGITDRHDMDRSLMYSHRLSLSKRLKRLYSPKYNPNRYFIFCKRHYNLYYALIEYIRILYLTIRPTFFNRGNI